MSAFCFVSHINKAFLLLIERKPRTFKETSLKSVIAALS